MNVNIQKWVSMVMVVAIALLLSIPFVPAVASEAAEPVEGLSVSRALSEAEGENDAADEGAAAVPEAMVSEEEAALVLGDDDAAAGEPAEAGPETMTRKPGPQDPWEVTSLDISKDVDVVTAPGVEISLAKTASESYTEMMVGEKKQITFYIEVDAELSDSYHIAGNIFVENTGDWPADVIAVSDTVWYKAGGPNWLAATSNITTSVPLGDNAIPTGGPHVYSYSGTFTLPVPLASVTAMSNLIEITISNKPDPPKPGMQNWTFHYRESFAKPSSGGSTQVTLEDIETITPDAGLSYEIKAVEINSVGTANLTGPWNLDLAYAPFTIAIHKELTAEKAGEYILNNKARIGDLESEVDVEIVVREPDREFGSITGYKYEDLDADGVLDEGEPPFAGITIELWMQREALYEVAFKALALEIPGEWHLHGETVTADDGSFHFGDLEPGYYLIREVLPEGVFASGPTEVHAWLDGGEQLVLEEIFLNYRLGRVEARKWLDLNADGILQDGEPNLAGVKIALEGEEVEMEALTGDDGLAVFEGLYPGEYIIREEVPDGYKATGAVEVGFALLSGETEKVDFLNAELLSAVSGFKYLDLNANGALDAGESGLAGVTIRLLDAEGKVVATAVTGDDGSYAFKGLRAGRYTVEEIVPEGYVATAATSHTFDLALNQTKSFDFFNNVLVAGEVINPPAVVAPAQPEAGQTLPATGIEMGLLLLMIGLMILVGASIASYGLIRVMRGS